MYLTTKNGCLIGVMVVTLFAACTEMVAKPNTVGKKESANKTNWSPINCQEWDYDTVYPANLSTEFDQTLKISDPLYYANFTWRPAKILFNNHVRHVGVRFSKFDVEQGWDKLLLRHKNGLETFTGQTGVQGNTPPPLGDFRGPYAVQQDAAYLPGYMGFTWYTDGSINYTGYKIDALQIHCTATPYAPYNLFEVETNYPYHGYLLDSGDVIYVKVRQPAGYEMGLLLWPRDNVDFDLYASTMYTQPTRAQADWIGDRGTKKVDMIKVPAPGADRWVYVAIGSYQGRGQFRFSANVHAPSNPTFDPVNVGVNFPPSNDNKNTVRRLVNKTAVAVYQATEGRVLLDKWHIHWNKANFGDIRLYRHSVEAGTYAHFTPEPDNPATTCWANQFDHIDVNTYHWCGVGDALANSCIWDEEDIEREAVDSMAHEIGHGLLGLRDERPTYYTSTHTCGRSLMSIPEAYLANITDFCVESNAGHDYTVHGSGASPHSSAENNWACIATKLYGGQTPVPPIPAYFTPDAFYRLEGDGAADFPNVDVGLGSRVVDIEETDYPD